MMRSLGARAGWLLARTRLCGGWKAGRTIIGPLPLTLRLTAPASADQTVSDGAAPHRSDGKMFMDTSTCKSTPLVAVFVVVVDEHVLPRVVWSTLHLRACGGRPSTTSAW